MKNIKIILLFFICLVAGSVLAQYVPYVPPTPIPAYNVPPQTFSGNYTSGTQNNVACNALVNQLYTSGTVSYSIKASNYVHITQPCSFQSASSSTFHAFIAPSGIDVVSYHPNGFSDIPRYDKFELGIKLPQNITDNINNFFGNKYYPAYDVHNPPYYNCNNGYGSIFDTNYINPYNPDQISLEATFSFPGKPDETVYGFYYREYTYDQADPTTGAPSYSATNWVEDTGLQYHWRVRFAPKYVGTYTVTWVVKVSGGGIVSILSDNIGQNFISISSTNPGFIKIGQNGKFLVTQPDPAGSQKTIIPVGVGVPFPAQGLIGTDGIPLNECPLYGCGYPWGLNTNNYSYPSRFWHHRDKIKTELSANGGNIVRIFNSPFSYDIEWEKAGVYDADQFKPIGPQGPNIGYQTPLQAQTYYKGNNRQAVMWEFDRMLDMAKDNNLYIQWVTEEGADNGFRAAGVGPDWSLNPYYNGVFLNPTDPLHIDQFFTDANAIAFYKKRLRYMIARYGYSTNIADFELVNEIHEFRGDNLPYNTNNTLDALFTPWLTTMTDYIKNPIVAGGLGHTDHLLTVSYEWANGLGIQPGTSDNIGSIQKLDFLSRHPYYYGYDLNKGIFTDLLSFKTQFNKPCQAGELGLSGGPCGNQLLMDFLNPTFHSMLWSSTFMGGLTSGLDNWGGNGGLDIDPFNPQYNYNCGSGFRQHFTPLQNFISSINFDAGNYVPRTFPFPNLITPNPTVAYYLIDNNGINARNAIGFVHNRSFHYYNFTQPNNNTFYDNTVATQYLNSIPPIGNCNFSAELPPAPQPVLTGNFGVISIQFLLPSTTFQVDWYETYSPANSILQSYTFTSDVGGSADILPPDFVNTCNGNEYAFKIHLPGPPSQRPSNSSLNFVLDSLSQLSSKPPVQNNKTGQSDIKQLINKFNIYPNPGSGLYTLSVGQEGNYTVEVLNAYGGIVKGFSFTGKQTVLNIENLSNGLYTFTIKSDKGNYVQKIIKQ